MNRNGPPGTIVRAMLAALLAVASGMSSAQSLMSQDLIKPGNETFTLDLGGIVNQFSTSVTLNGSTTNGSNLDLESNGLKKNLSSFTASGTWRFLPRHRIDMLYFSADRSGSRQYDTQITIADTVFPIGATVDAEAKDRFLIADYRYSFVKTDTLEFAGLLGVYGGQFKFNISARGNEALNARSASSTSSTTVPVPLIGATVDWYIDPRWKVSANLAGLKANIGDVDGSVLVAGASLEYLLARNFGLGARYMYSDVDVDVSKSDFNGNISWRMNSWSLYLKLLY
jgi:hypothetical protein